jgi:hypothetical protein
VAQPAYRSRRHLQARQLWKVIIESGQQETLCYRFRLPIAPDDK